MDLRSRSKGFPTAPLTEVYNRVDDKTAYLLPDYFLLIL